MTTTRETPRTDAANLRANQYSDDARVVPATLACTLEHELATANATIAELREALEYANKAYQDMFDVMPVAWQGVDDYISAALGYLPKGFKVQS